MTGLSDTEVSLRKQNGQVNINPDVTVRNSKQIITSNIFTLFNAINIILAILVFITGHFRNALFMLVIIFNTAIGIAQELRAKKTLDKLRMLSQPHANVLRNNKLSKISGEELVLNDICKLKLGDQILSDGRVIEGHVGVNESLLTGEADTIEKKAGDELFAGSYITSGTCYMEVTKVGQDNYIYHILKNVKREKKQPSRLKDALDFIIKSVSVIIIPLGIILFYKQYFISQISLNETILQTVASLVGMIPEGLVLLTSVSLTLGALKLSNENTLVQELYSLETLARCDVLCLDKTGTITSGRLKVIDTIKYSDDDIDNIIANMMDKAKDENQTAMALKNYYHLSKDIIATKIESFSSATKKTVMESNDIRYELGAYEFLDAFKDTRVESDIKANAEKANRVLALSKNHKIIALVIIQDEIRNNAAKTLAYFEKQKVELKIISGDDAFTVANILKKVNFAKADRYVDCSNLSDEELKEKLLCNNIFGRVNPDQKCMMIEYLKENGHTVGMVGDGVNDVMALKEADFSIAMYEGADSAKNVANVVLLDNDFSHMHKIVNEGRRVINNIQRTATLFLSKTVLSIGLSILTIFLFKEYPFSPIQLTLLSTLCIGFPSFILSFEPNYEIVKGNFLANVLSRAIPSALGIIISIVVVELCSHIFPLISLNDSQTIIVFITFFTLVYVLYDISKPLNYLRTSLIIIAIIGIFTSYFIARDFFYLSNLNFEIILVIFILSTISIIFYRFFQKKDIASKIANRIDEWY